jgi:hypothetical protein
MDSNDADPGSSVVSYVFVRLCRAFQSAGQAALIEPVFVTQDPFTSDVSTRDACCWLTDAWYTKCDAVHIVPETRRDVSGRPCETRECRHPRRLIGWRSVTPHPQVYKEIYGPWKGERFVDRQTSGILLRRDMHESFDRYEWSLYCSEVGRFGPHSVITLRTLRESHAEYASPPLRTVVTTSTYSCPALKRPNTMESASTSPPGGSPSSTQEKACRIEIASDGITSSVSRHG